MAKLLLGKTSEVPPNGARTFVKHGKKILVVRVDGGFVAYDNFCPHMGGALRSDGTAKLKCGWHGATFDARTGEATNEVIPGGTLDKLTVSVEGDDLYWEQPDGVKSPWADDF